MNVLECVLIIAGLSANVFLMGQYEGSMIRRLDWKRIFSVCLIAAAFEIGSMLVGYLLTRIPFFSESSSGDLVSFCYFVAAVLFLIIAVYMIYKAVLHTPIQEKLREIGYKRILLEAFVIAFFTFMAGIGWGFLGHRIMAVSVVIGCVTVLAALGGIRMGYDQGCRFRYTIYGAGGAMLAFVGVDILVRYL